MWLLGVCLLTQAVGLADERRALVQVVVPGVEQRSAPGGGAPPDSGVDRRALLASATRARLAYRHPEAQRLYARLLRVSPPIPDRLSLDARLGLAESRLVSGPYDAAIADFESAATVAAELGDSAARVEALLGSAYARSRMERPGAAMAEFSLAERLVPPDSLALRAAVACTRAAAMVQQSLPEARRVAEVGLAFARRSGDRRREGFCLRVLGSHYVYAGDQRPALAALDQAADLQRYLGDRVELANTLRWRGWFLLNWHDYPAADRDLSLALLESRAVGLAASEGWTLRHRAALAWRFGDLTAAFALLDSAEAILVRQRDPWGVVSARGLRGDVAMEAGRYEEAEAGFHAQVEFGEREGRPIETYTGRLGLVHLSMRRHDWAAAELELQALRRFTEAHRQTGWNMRLEYEAGIVALRRRQPALARSHLRAYLAALGAADHLAAHAARSRLAEVHLLEGDPDAAIAELNQAARLLDSLRLRLDARGLRLLAFQGRRAYDDDAGFTAVVAGLVAAGRVEAAFEFAERRRARLLADRLLEAGLRRSSAPASAAQLRAALPDSTALLFLHAGRLGQPTMVFLVQREGISATAAPGMEVLGEPAQRFVTLIRGASLASDPGIRLRQALFDPLLPELAPGVTSLVIVPDGELHRLPFEALPLPDGRPLVSRYAVTMAPSATIAAELWARPRGGAGMAALALGDPDFQTAVSAEPGSATVMYQDAFAEAGGLPRLRASGEEARSVRRFAPGAVVRLGQGASEAWLKETPLASYRLIHLATHAVVDERVQGHSSLALAPGAGQDGFVGAEELAALRLGADLVVLSACRTADGVIVGGEGIQGLTAPLLEAGARGVVATLWQVHDAAAARFSERFYGALAGGEPASMALRSAKLAAAAAGEPAEEWAAFVLVGDGTIVLPLQVPRRLPPGPRSGAILLLGLAGYWVIRRARGSPATSLPS